MSSGSTGGSLACYRAADDLSGASLLEGVLLEFGLPSILASKGAAKSEVRMRLALLSVGTKRYSPGRFSRRLLTAVSMESCRVLYNGLSLEDFNSRELKCVWKLPVEY